MRARYALRALGENAGDALAVKSFEEQVSRAREAVHDSPATAVTLFRSALNVLPRRYDVRLELAQGALKASEPTAVEPELSLIIVAPDALDAVKSEARIARAALYSPTIPVEARLACRDYDVVWRSSWGTHDQRVRLGVCYAVRLALVDVQRAERLLETFNGLSGDDLALASLARAILLQSKGRSLAEVTAEMDRARASTSSDETRSLIDKIASSFH